MTTGSMTQAVRLSPMRLVDEPTVVSSASWISVPAGSVTWRYFGTISRLVTGPSSAGAAPPVVAALSFRDGARDTGAGSRDGATRASAGGDVAAAAPPAVAARCVAVPADRI